jgi:hypothetical protein
MTTTNIQNDIQIIMNNFTKDEINELVLLHTRYEKMVVMNNVFCHTLSGLTTIFSFLSITFHPFSIVAGILGVSTSASIAFSNYLIKAMKSNDNELQKYLNQFGIKDTIIEPNDDNDDNNDNTSTTNNIPTPRITPTPTPTPASITPTTQVIVQA